MADDNADAKVAAAVAVTAALFSPRLRGLLRRGAVHGLAGVLTAGDALASFARGVSRGLQEAPAPATRGEPATTGAEAAEFELVGGDPATPPPDPGASEAARAARRARPRPRVAREPESGSPAAPTAATPSEAAHE